MKVWGLAGITLAVLLLPLVAATQPPKLENDVLIIPYTTNGTEHTEDIFFKTSSGLYLYSAEQDPDYSIKIWWVNNRTIGLRIETNPARLVNLNPPIEICIGENDEFDIPGLKKKDIHEPINCRGGKAVSFDAIKTNTDYTFMLKSLPQGFEFFIGDGARGGGTIGCTPLPNCDIINVNNYCTPSSTNTETNFCYGVSVVMNTEPTCSCPLEFKDNPVSLAYYVITSTYQSYYTKPQAKLISGLASRTISSSGNYHITAQCGGMHGTLYLKAGGGSAGFYSKTVSCNDVVKPAINQLNPPNAFYNVTGTYDFRCNATDNTALRTIELWANFSGAWALEQTQAYTYLTYSATKTFTETLTAGSYAWACKAEDTRSPYNDLFVGNRTLTIYDVDTGLIFIDLPLSYKIKPLKTYKLNSIVMPNGLFVQRFFYWR